MGGKGEDYVMVRWENGVIQEDSGLRVRSLGSSSDTVTIRKQTCAQVFSLQV